MGRFSPTVLPHAPRYVPPIDLTGAASSIADALDDRRQRQDRRRLEQKADDRYYNEQNQRSIDKALDRQRQGEQDKIAAEDRKRARERQYLDTLRDAGDMGLVDGGTSAKTAASGRQLSASAPAVGGTMGAMATGVGDALAAIDGPNARRMSITRPDDGTETLTFDPTQTKDAREDASWYRRQQLLNGMKPTPRNPIADELEEYEGKLKIDKKYGINDFAPREPRGGGSGTGNAATKNALSSTNTQFDNANSVVARIEREEPAPPNFSKWRGGEVPDAKLGDSPDVVKAWQADSTNMAQNYEKAHSSWQARHSEAARRAQYWQQKGDSIAKALLNESGGASISDQQRVNAAREISQLQREVNATFAGMGNDEIGKKELRQRYFDMVREINTKYGIRPGPED